MRVRGLTAIVLLLAGLGRGLENFVRRDRPHELGLPPRGLACDRHATRTIRFFTICTINGTAMRMGFAENHWTALLPFFALLFAGKSHADGGLALAWEAPAEWTEAVRSWNVPSDLPPA